ncbi:OPT oligopeptide transporter protein-domain-containing protein [Zychaea mexicana]|uniref:OPT oligopeptide transporter protein-domain-containing protein n=1 Tax=Zychaea mexicana TaxID=64656 RepID=UPI0022FE8FBF|nr:OPT oligopeptide transporter protein-domain-containing protein [Zychaea mexicana]KAI9491800.1 OPT oligopeptide transporter protein-domain-containing protein [Zychaea mexicana]
MCFSNMYFGLQSGWISMMSLQASLLGYAIFKPFRDKLRTPFGPIENVVLQTTAVATATMPLAAGFVGIIPALGLLTSNDHPDGPIVLSSWQLVLWSLGVAFFGVFFAVPLRKQTIIHEKLRFPSGTATAQMISLLHQDPQEPILRRRHQSSRDSVLEHEDRPLLVSSSSPTYSPTSTGSNQSGVALTPIAHSDLHTSTRQREGEQDWSLKLHALTISFSLSSAYTLLSYFFPIIYALPLFNWLSFNLIDFAKWEWYFAPSLSYVGQGIIMGLPTTLSMLLGCVIGWGILSPIAHYAGWAPGPVSDWKTGSKGWILWISLGVMVAESVVSLAIVSVRSIIKLTAHKRARDDVRYQRVDADEQSSDADTAESHIEQEWVEEQEGTRSKDEREEKDAPPEQLVKTSTTIIGLVASTLLCVCVIAILFGTDVLPIRMAILAIAVAMFLSVLAVRALGETDLNPVSGIGKISQVIFAMVMPGGIAANLIAGGIAEAGAQQAGDLMQDLKTGHLLQASPKAQFYGQLIGSFVSAFVATAAYKLYTTVYTIPGPEFPVPTAHVWLDMSRLVNGHPLPPHVSEFVLFFALIFAALVLLKETKPGLEHVGWRRCIPQGIAFAIGMYNPPNFTLARVIGGFLGHWWDRYCDVLEATDGNRNNMDSSIWDKLFGRYRRHVGKVFIIIVASGFVLGEGTFAIVNLVLRACNVPHF